MIKIFQVVTTGKNLNYGKKGEKRLLGDNSFMYALKHGVIEPDNFKYVGSGKNSKHPKVKLHEKLMPIRWINAEKQLETQGNRLIRVAEEVIKLKESYDKLKGLIENEKRRNGTKD